MKTIVAQAILAFFLLPGLASAQTVLDFSRAEAISVFRVINDGVMGGVSSSRIVAGDGSLVFEGALSLDNNGGFASFRGPARFAAPARALFLTVRGDGQRYRLTLKLDDSNATGQYQASFVAPRDWTTLRFLPGDFSFSFRGRAQAAPAVDFGQVASLGLLIADAQAGAFRIEAKSLRAE